MHWNAQVDALRSKALLAMQQRRWQEAEEALEVSRSLARPMPYPYAEAKALYVYGQLHVAKGEPDRARQRFAQALAVCARLGERLYAEHIEQALAELG
jgi:tetratricopeptide (TPR) repeat protein